MLWYLCYFSRINEYFIHSFSRDLTCSFAVPQSLFVLGSLIPTFNMFFDRSSVVFLGIDSIKFSWKSIDVVKISFVGNIEYIEYWETSCEYLIHEAMTFLFNNKSDNDGLFPRCREDQSLLNKLIDVALLLDVTIDWTIDAVLIESVEVSRLSNLA